MKNELRYSANHITVRSERYSKRKSEIKSLRAVMNVNRY